LKSYVRRSHAKIAALKFEEMRVERFWKKGLGRNLSLNLTSRTVQPDKSLTPRPHSAQLSPDRMVQVCQPKKEFNDLKKFDMCFKKCVNCFQQFKKSSKLLHKATRGSESYKSFFHQKLLSEFGAGVETSVRDAVCEERFSNKQLLCSSENP
jgi:hypothetical protein